ncbi:ATP-binding protein [Halobacteriales archaeon Cl-PHB]
MSFVIGRESGVDAGPVANLGTYRALDGSEGAPLYLDLDGPHAMLVVGKRGYGKSYTLGVVAEALARTEGVAPVVVDPMGEFRSLAESADQGPVPTEVVETPTVKPTALDPRSWCALLGLSPESGAGGLVWQAAAEAATLDGMRRAVRETDAAGADSRAAINHLDLADSWGVFDAGGLGAQTLGGAAVTVVDVAGLDDAPMNAVVRGIAEALYRGRTRETIDRLPWLLLDEAHTVFDGVARPALETILTRGRTPGVSLVAATQRPSALPTVGVSQADVLVAHRLTAEADLDALRAARPTYVTESLADRLPTTTGAVLVVDDASETVHTASIRRRQTPHDGESPRASEVTAGE